MFSTHKGAFLVKVYFIHKLLPKTFNQKKPKSIDFVTQVLKWKLGNFSYIYFSYFWLLKSSFRVEQVL